MKLMRIGVDLAKNVFQIHGVDCHEKPVWRQRLTRERWSPDARMDLATTFRRGSDGA